MPAQLNPSQAQLGHDAYFALEQAEDQRYEYLGGEIFAMAGGSESHALIAMNAGALLVNSLRGRPCRVYGADMKLYIAARDHFCYPDLQVLCAEGRRRERYVEAPAMVVEVLSSSTEPYDRGLKFEHYRTIPELQHYLLLSQERPHAEWFSRTGEGIWRFEEASGLEDSIRLAAWALELPLAEIYREVLFPAVINLAIPTMNGGRSPRKEDERE